jgi:hypothetical protein
MRPFDEFPISRIPRVRRLLLQLGFQVGQKSEEAFPFLVVFPSQPKLFSFNLSSFIYASHRLIVWSLERALVS